VLKTHRGECLTTQNVFTNSFMAFFSSKAFAENILGVATCIIIHKILADVFKIKSYQHTYLV